MEKETSGQTAEVEVQAQPVVLAEHAQKAAVAAQQHWAAMQFAYKAMFARCQKLFYAGKRAKQMDWARTSTAYNDPAGDDFFFAGYDGESWESACKRIMGVTNAA